MTTVADIINELRKYSIDTVVVGENGQHFSIQEAWSDGVLTYISIHSWNNRDVQTPVRGLIKCCLSKLFCIPKYFVKNFRMLFKLM